MKLGSNGAGEVGSTLFALRYLFILPGFNVMITPRVVLSPPSVLLYFRP